MNSFPRFGLLYLAVLLMSFDSPSSAITLPAETKPDWFRSNAGLSGITLECRNFQAYTTLDAEGGFYLASIDLSKKEALSLVHNNFFDWWEGPVLPDNLAKVTYLMLDIKGDHIPLGVYPKLDEKLSYLYISGYHNRRLYVLRGQYEGHPRLYYFYLGF